MPLKGFAGLSLEGPPDSRPGTARSERGGDDGDARPGSLSKQASFDVSGTNTFTADDLRIRGESGVESASDGAQLSAVNFADLEKVKAIGKGASGRVLLMKHSRGGDFYALKEMSAVADQDARRMAINEIKIAHRHAKACDNLVATLDAYYNEGKIGILMEFCDGGSLVEVLASSRGGLPGLPPLPLGPIVVQMLHGLRYMHREMKQVHRDLKPANVLVSGSGVVKLSDFGVAKQLSSSDGFAMTQVGSTAYMSPERMKGEEYTYTSDVWSVGVILLEALLGEHPFPPSKHKSFVALFTAISSGDYPPPPAGTEPEVAECVASCLRLDQQHRPEVDALIAGKWLGAFGNQAKVRQKVQTWLLTAATAAMKAEAAQAAQAQAAKDEAAQMKAQAKAMAAKAIARSEMPGSDE